MTLVNVHFDGGPKTHHNIRSQFLDYVPVPESEMKDTKKRGNELGRLGNSVKQSPRGDAIPGISNKVNLPSLLRQCFR